MIFLYQVLHRTLETFHHWLVRHLYRSGENPERLIQGHFQARTSINYEWYEVGSEFSTGKEIVLNNLITPEFEPPVEPGFEEVDSLLSEFP